MAVVVKAAKRDARAGSEREVSGFCSRGSRQIRVNVGCGKVDWV